MRAAVGLTNTRNLTVVVVLAACAASFRASELRGQNAAPGDRIHYVAVVAKDYAYDLPKSIPEGIVTFHLMNQGSDVHHLQLVELGVGHTLKEFFETMRAKGEPPAWTTTVGLTPTIQPNNEAFLTLRLAPGRYILACMIAARDGRTHVEKGMYQLVVVTPRPRAAPSTKRP